MRIWVTRHAQTDYNKNKQLQGRTNLPLNEAGIAQAKKIAGLVADVTFDAVYSSPLKRCLSTASIISGKSEKEIIIDSRLIEVDFGIYEKKKYHRMGLRMTAYWMFPEVFKAPPSVEPVSSMVERSSSFLKEIESKNFENVLIVCHGGIIRAIRGYLEDRRNGIKWRPKPKNCEIRVYESVFGQHRFVKDIIAE